MKQAIFLLASLAFARATTTTTDEHSLRGGGMASPSRSLQDTPVQGLRPGESSCVLHPDNDGTVECTVRSQFSAYDATYNPTTSLGCVTDSLNGYQFCANIGLNLQADPNGSLPPPPGISGPVAGSTMPGIGVDFPITEPSTGVVSTSSGCPRFLPDPGSHCTGWIPDGATTVSCQWGTTECNCARQDGDATKFGWNCPDLTTGGSGAIFPIPAPVPVPMIPDTVVVGQVEAEISDLELPKPVVAPPRSEQVGVAITNNQNCPGTRPSGSGCAWYDFNFQCAYEDDESQTGWVTCGCTKYGYGDDDSGPGWKCRDFSYPGFSSF